MEINKVKLIGGGLKGACVDWTEVRLDKNKRRYIDSYEKEKNDMIHMALDRPFKDLRFFILEICGIISPSMDQTEIDYAVAECEIESVNIGQDSFTISGSKRCVGDKFYKIKTPKIEEDDNYHNFDKVMTLIELIKTEAAHYIKGSAVVTDEECAVRYITSGKDKSMDMDAYNNMSAEEKKQFHISVIEKLGGFVTMESDILEDTPENHEILSIEAPAIDIGHEEQTIDTDNF